MVERLKHARRIFVAVPLMGALLFSTACSLEEGSLGSSFEAQPELICRGETTNLEWEIYDDGSCDECRFARALDPDPGSPLPDGSDGGVSVSPAETQEYAFSGSMCRSGECNPIADFATVEVVPPATGDRIDAILEGTCGPRWSIYDLESKMSSCLEIINVCSSTGQRIVLHGTTADGSFLESVFLTDAECTDIFNGGGKIFSGQIHEVVVDPLRYRCGTVESGGGRDPSDVYISIDVRCRNEPECTL